MRQPQPRGVLFQSGEVGQGPPKIDGRQQLGEPSPAALLHGLRQCALPTAVLFNPPLTACRPNRLDSGHAAFAGLLQKPLEPVGVLGGGHPQRQPRARLWKTGRRPHLQEGLALARGNHFGRKNGALSVGQLNGIAGLGPKHLAEVTGLLRPQLVGTRGDTWCIETAHGAKKKRQDTLRSLRRFLHSQPAVSSPPHAARAPPRGPPRTHRKQTARNSP